MKITNELKSKVERIIDAKYGALKTELVNELDKIKNDSAKKIYDNLIKSFKVCPELESYIKRDIYGSGTIEKYVIGNINKFVNLADNKNYKLVSSKITDLNIQRAEEMDNILIKLSYGKNFDDIQTILKEYEIIIK